MPAAVIPAGKRSARAWAAWTLGAPMGALLGRLVAAQRTEQLAARGVPLDYLGRLLRAFDGKHAVPHPGRGAAAAVSGMVESLTGREAEDSTWHVHGRVDATAPHRWEGRRR